MSHYIVGLTGGIGSGKTTVANELIKQGTQQNIVLVDADVIARDVVKPGSVCLNEIVSKFGQEILLPDKTLNRAQLRTAIFSDPDKKSWLNALMHPAIRIETLKQLNQANSVYCLFVAPLLFENQLERLVDTTVVVDVPQDLQISRTTTRDDVSLEQVQNIIKAQISRAERLDKADIVVDNAPPWEQVAQQIVVLHETLMDLSKKKP